MGLVYAEIALINSDDLALARCNIIVNEINHMHVKTVRRLEAV